MAPPGGPKAGPALSEGAGPAVAAPGGQDPTPAAEAAPPPPPREWAAGERCSCKASFDGRLHQARVVEVQAGGEGSPEAGVSGRAYVHYLDFNKRLDEWVALENLQSPGEAGEGGGAAGAEGGAGGGAGAEAGGAGPKPDDTAGRKMTRNFKRRYDEIHHVEKPVEELPAIDQQLERLHEEKTKVKNIQVVELGRWEMDTWYYSPYPEEYATCHKIFLCEYCLKYLRTREALVSHHQGGRCKLRRPPGREIYRADRPPSSRHENPLSVFEIDGRDHNLYCQNLGLLAKLFLDHKTCYYDTAPFNYYVVTERDRRGHHLVGYFSKEKVSAEGYNLACILTLPSHQRKGYGGFLIAFSYELSKREGRVGTPERPLSDLGQVSYRSYWSRVVLELLREHRGNLSVKEISHISCIRVEDIVSTLQTLGLIKYWKGQHVITASTKVIEEHLRSKQHRPGLEIVSGKIQWQPPPPPVSKRSPRVPTPRS